MSSIVVTGDTSGSVSLSAPAVAGTTTLTLPSVSGTVLTSASSQVNGPAFSAYSSASQTGLTSSTYVKVNINAKVFDTNSNFDSATNYRFTPTVAGYYQVNASIYFLGTINGYEACIYKNGVENTASAYSNSLASIVVAPIAGLIYMNGSTDYLELYAFCTTSAGTWSINGIAISTYFQASMVRSA